MLNKKLYAKWKAKVENLKTELLKKDTLLRQYAIWLETSEENTIYKGEDVYHMLVGVLQGLSDVDFIPGVGWENFVAVVGEVQKETGLDLGVCQFLDYKPNRISKCKATDNLHVGSLSVCLPHERNRCGYRKAKLEQVASQNIISKHLKTILNRFKNYKL